MAEPNERSLSRQSGSVAGPSRQANSVVGWQSEADAALRRTVFEKILYICREVCQRNGPRLFPAEWLEKLPGWADQVEEAMYYRTDTKEEYADPANFECKVQAAAKFLNGIQRAKRLERQPGCQSMPSDAFMNMMPSQGNSSVSGVATGMMPTSGGTGAMVPLVVPTPETLDDSLMSLLEELNLEAEDK